MWRYRLLFVFLAWWSLSTPAAAQWSCVSDAACSDLLGAVCRAGTCVCRAGTQPALAGSACIDVAPYYTSECVEDHQCSRLFVMYECRRENQTDATGACFCQPGQHYFQGRCWPTAGYGEPCTSDAHCLSVMRDPYALKCNGTCVCANGYYERQRGECRRIAYAIGDGCVLNEDCQFTNGACDINTLKCYDITVPLTTTAPEETVTAQSSVNVNVKSVSSVSVRSHSQECDVSTPCPAPFECSVFGGCVCPSGYYLSDNGLSCNAELGSISTAEQCVGLLAEVINGICTCPANFFFDENMRDCVKVTRQITDSCVSDANCHTFGASARCGAPRDPWQLRTCECDTEQAVWDAARQMCRLFAGIGEECEVDSDCLAGELEIQCVAGTCTCPPDLAEFEGLCLTTGLALGDACQASLECTETTNTECSDGICSCTEGYQEENGFCAAIIGGSCIEDNDCVINNTICVNHTTTYSSYYSSHLGSSQLGSSHMGSSLTRLIREVNSRTCQCREGFVAYNDTCWTVSDGIESQCTVNSQCRAVLGDNSLCFNETCACIAGYHHRDNGCWPQTGLFEPCARTSECYLSGISEYTVCRNSVCQCVFEHPYNEQLHTCGDGSKQLTGASAIPAGSALFAITLAYITTYL